MTFPESTATRRMLVQQAGEQVTVAGSTIYAVHDREFVETQSVTGFRPVLLCVDEDVASAVKGSAAVARSVNYTVQGIEPDGTGMTLLVLERV